MVDLTRDTVEQHLRSFTEPYADSDPISAKQVKDIQLDGNRVRVHLRLGFPAAGYAKTLSAQVRNHLAGLLPEGCEVQVEVDWKIVAHEVQKGLKPLDGVRNVIAVASGKGGVGKSTTAANLALALSAEGARVGLLDADIYGPSQPRMMGAHGRPHSSDGKHVEPIMAHGIQTMSIGFLIDEETPMVWRGPMVTQALTQLLNDTRWKDLDYLIIDLPPGTGDIQLTLAQRVPVSGSLIVTTPQDIALLDARKGLKMFEKVDVPVLGIVENMSIHICSNCGHAEHIFGEGGGERMAAQYEVPFLGSLPLDIRIREEADGGHPTVVADPDGEIAARYRDIARRTAARLAQQARDFSHKFPNIVIQNN